VPLNAILPIGIRHPGVGLQPRACEVGARLDAAARATPQHLHIKGEVETGIAPPLRCCGVRLRRGFLRAR
jgi:hypothetical protein